MASVGKVDVNSFSPLKLNRILHTNLSDCNTILLEMKKFISYFLM